MSKQHASKTLPPKPMITSDQLVDTSNSKKLGIATKINKQVTLEGLLQDNSIVYRNFYIHEMRSIFPERPALWHVEKMIELKSGKKLLIDEPVKEWEVKECQEKADSLNKLGFIYILVMPEMSLAETLSQMGLELH